MIHGILFDVYPDYEKDKMITWLLTQQGPKMIQGSYHPCFYVQATTSELHLLASQLRIHPYVEDISFKNVKATLGSTETTMVLQVIPKKLIYFHRLARTIDAWGEFHRYQLYDVDLRMPTRYLQERHLFFNAQVTWTGDHFLLRDEQWAVDYPSTSFSTVTLSTTRKSDHRILSPQDKITSIHLNDTVIEEENEADCILSALTFLRTLDPDIIYTVNGDTMLFPFLFQRACINGLKDHFNLSRDTSVHFNPVKKATSYFSYGRIIHRPAFYTLAGRAHIDTGNSFFHSECGFHGLLDVSRCANISFQLLSRLGPGTAISQIQVNTAQEQGYVIPWKKNQPETWKTASELLSSDRGGIILDPVVGLHEDVVELDYASLYPNIMLTHNISPETLFCSRSTENAEKVPQLSYYLSVEHTGLLPTVLKPILDRRFLFKARSKNSSYDTQRYQQLQQAWKWILLVCFGYTGYRNARYGRIECHESITAFSRDVLIKAMHLAERSGYHVLHGIIDSLWIQQRRPGVSPQKLARMISNETGIRMDIEGRYHWIVFLPNKATGVGALNRYYGLFDHGEIKVRGVELRQHNTPPFFKQMQQQMLAVLQEAHTKTEFYQLIPKTLLVSQSAVESLINRRYDPLDLVLTTRVSKDISSYKVDNVVKAALQQVHDAGVTVHPGQMIQYVVTDERGERYSERVCLREMVTENTSVDVVFYLRFLSRCVETLLSPFGYTMEAILEGLQRNY